MHNQPLVYAIVVNYNGLNYLRTCLSSLEHQTYQNLKIIVFDNASTDGSQIIVEDFPQVTCIPSKVNLGFTGANNIAVKFALEHKADYIFLVNNDTESESELIEKLVSVCEKDAAVGISSPAVFDINNRAKLQELGMSADRFAYPLTNTSPLKDNPSLFFVSGCSMMIKAGLIRRIGMFDEEYFLFVEDLDFCWRAQLAGYQIAVDSTARIYHASGGSLTGGVIKTTIYRTNVRRFFFREKNTLRTLIKNYGLYNLATVVPFYVSLLLIESLLWLFLLKPSTSEMNIQAVLWNIQKLPETLRKRVIIQGSRRISDREITKRMVKGYNKLRVYLVVGVPQFKK